MKKIILLFVALCFAAAAYGQVQTAKVGSKVPNVEIRDSNNDPIWIPNYGKKHLLIFYPDPDHANQNKEFVDYLENNHIISDNIEFMGIVNLKDAPLLPNSLIRSIIRKKEKKNDTKVLTDPDHLLRDAWGLGDINNKFVFLFVTRDGIIEYFKKGELSQADIDEFWRVVNKYI